MKSKIIAVCLALFCCGCGLFKEARKDIPPPPPRLDYRENEEIKMVAKVTHELAIWIRANGVKPGDQRTMLLENGTKVILKYVGEPYEDVDANDLKKDNSIINHGNDVAEDFQKDNAKYDDTLNDKRESLIHQTNLKWAWGRIFGFGIGTWILAIIGIPILCAFFPVIIPVVSLIWQLLKAGIGAATVVAKFGITGITNLIVAIEKFREAHKGTETGKALDAHLSAAMSDKDKVALDALKNHFGI